MLSYGASPRGPIGLVQSARALALLRGRRHVLAGDIRDLAPEVLRHRLVLSYEGLSDGVSADSLLEQILEAVPEPDLAASGTPGSRWRREPALLQRPGSRGPRGAGPPSCGAGRAPGAGRPERAGGGARPRLRAPGGGPARGRAPGRRSGHRHRAGAAAPLPARRRRAPARPGRQRPHRHAARAPARARADAHDLARCRPLALDGLRHGRPAEERRGRGRGRRGRARSRCGAAAGSACSPSARRSRGCCRRAAGAARGSALRRALAEGVAPDGAAGRAARGRAGAARAAGAPAPASWWSSPTSPASPDWARPLAALCRPPHRARGRDPRPARARAPRRGPHGDGRPGDGRARRGRHARAGACASASPRRRARASGRRWRERCAGRAPST